MEESLLPSRGMNLYVVRHGIALDVGEQGICCDEDRPLSAVGRQKTEAVAKGLARLGVKPEIVAASPLLRAAQTAEILHHTLGVYAPLEIKPFLAPGGTPVACLEWCAELDAGSVMVVGHMPDVTWLTWTCLRKESPQDLHFKKAAVACIHFPAQPAPKRGKLEWFHPPGYLRRLAHEDE